MHTIKVIEPSIPAQTCPTLQINPPRKRLRGILPMIDLRSALQQQLHQIMIAVLRGQMQRRVSTLIRGVDIGTPDEEQLGRVGVALPDGVVQGPQALRHRLVRLGAARQEDADLVQGLHADYRVGQLPLQRIGYALGRHLWGKVVG